MWKKDAHIQARVEKERIRLDSEPMVKYKSAWEHLLLQENSPRIQALKLKQGPRRRYEH